MKTKIANFTKAILIASFLVALPLSVITPIKADAPKDRQGFLPTNPDKVLETDKEKIVYFSITECKKRGLDQKCAEDIQAMAYVESRFDCQVVGDFGASKGCLQIHQGYHKHIKQEQAEDPQFAVNWTLDRLEHYGYPENRDYAIRRHNGSPTNPKTLNYLNEVNKYLTN